MKMLRLLRCPHCHANDLQPEGAGTRCSSCGVTYPHCGGRPVLLRYDNTLFSPADYPVQPPPRQRRRPDWVPSPSVNLSRDRVLEALFMRLRKQDGDPAVVLIVGAGIQRDFLLRRLGGERYVQILCVDIDVSADVDFYADAHELPCIDGSVDMVITTAVLEHVLDPMRAASEITRVLRIGGLLYSELPFMQQVHEGAYDFTRFTLSGHRRLFNRFHEIEAGMVAGPGTSLLWALENFATAFFSGHRARLMVRAMTRLLCFWLKWIDHCLVHKPAAMDGASCTYLFAERMGGTVGDDQIIRRYIGGRHMSHT